MRYIRYFLLLSLFSITALAAEAQHIEGKLDIQLQEPHFSNGVLSTENGGIIRGKDLFLQAKVIHYTKTVLKGEPIQTVRATGELFFQYQGKPYTGERVEIDLIRKVTTIYNGYTSASPWFVGGEKIILHDDGRGTIENGFITTSENEANEWTAEASRVFLNEASKVKARSVKFFFAKLPIMWIPTYSRDLRQDNGAPFSLRIRKNSGAALRIGITYDLIKTKTFKGQTLLDIGTNKGLGLGFAGRYNSLDKKSSFYTYNYIARDLQKKNESNSLRYRLQGKYGRALYDNKIQFQLTYDKTSDSRIGSDYKNRFLESARVMPTQARFTRKTSEWISSLNTKVRINNFQTVKEQLPLFSFNSRPLQLGEKGPILDSTFNAGFLNYKYSHNSPHLHNFHSSRVELSQLLYKQIKTAGVTTTPHIGYSAIHYNNSPQHRARMLAIGKIGFESHMRFIRSFSKTTQSLEPYVEYQYLSRPTTSGKNHYIFDLQDGWHELNMMRFGMRNSLMTKSDLDTFIKRYDLDLYTRACIHTKTVPTAISKIYLDTRIKPTACTAYKMDFAYDIKHNLIDHLNIAADFTLSEDIALALEWRRRSQYAWRKIDSENFILDSFHSTRSLKKSALSDRRDTLLMHLFFVITPTISLDLHTKHGCKRTHQPSYNEYGAEVVTLLRGAMKITLSYTRKPKNSTYALHFSLGGKKRASEGSFDGFGRGNYDN